MSNPEKKSHVLEKVFPGLELEFILANSKDIDLHMPQHTCIFKPSTYRENQSNVSLLYPHLTRVVVL